MPPPFSVTDGVINKKQLEIGAPTLTLTKTYDGSTNVADNLLDITMGTVTGREGNDNATTAAVSVASAYYNSKDVATASNITVTYTVTGTDSGNYFPPANSTVTGASITKAALTLSGVAVTTTRDYNGTDVAVVTNQGTLSGVAAGETVNHTTTAAFSQSGVGTGLTVTVNVGISAGAGADLNNYTAPTASYTYSSAGVINKAAGAPVSGAPTESAKTATTLTVSTVTVNGNTLQNAQQTVEYGVSTSNVVEPLSWQPTTTFDGLTPATLYYVYARSAESDNYNAGPASLPVSITTINPDAAFSFSVVNNTPTQPVSFEDGEMTVGAYSSLTVTVSPPSGGGTWESYSWTVNSVPKGDNSDTLTIAGIDYTVGVHHIMVVVYKNGIPYSQTINFTVEF
uniref:YDG domain-containing protein n=1 Tax=uncultured bacterium contig00140 TaxID=1181583 RepID=A0A806KNE5_9BACT|nr:hypothetical protein [uncultured bacterium contig00140]